MTIKTYQYKNGLTIIHQKHNKDRPISSIQVFCKVGSVKEPENLRGASHLVEHMLFKGTPKHPTSQSILDACIGIDFNAYTDKWKTCYHVKCSEDNISNSIHILDDMLFHSFFHKHDYLNERKVVEEENIKNADDLETIMAEEFDRILFSQTEYQYPVDTLEYHHSKNTLMRNDVFHFYKQHYQPQNIVISIYSTMSFDEIISIIQKTEFATKENNKMSNDKLYTTINSPTPISYKFIQKPNTITTYISVGFIICPYNHPDKYAIELFQTILSGGMNAFLFDLLRNKHGLTYTSDTITEYYKDIGSFVIFAEVHHTKVIRNGKEKGVLPLILDDVIQYFIEHGISLKQLNDAKKILFENILLDAEDSHTIPQHNAIEWMMNKSIIQYELLFNSKYKDISLEQVNTVIRRYLKKENRSICLVGSTPISQKNISKII